MPMWGWGYTGGWWVGLLMMLLFWAVVIVGIVLVVRALTGPDRGRSAPVAPSAPPTPPAGPSPSALSILEERFARGEIDEQEFRSRRATLTGGPPGTP